MKRRRNTPRYGSLIVVIAAIVVMITAIKAEYKTRNEHTGSFSTAATSGTEIAGTISSIEGTLNVAGNEGTDPAAFDTPAITSANGEAQEAQEPGLPFTKSEIERGKKSFIELSELDDLGRCSKAIMSFTKADMPTAKRGEIGNIKPSGWVQAKYDPGIIGSDSPYLYNRCHLLAYMFSGLNDDRRNLITGTRQMNLEMLNKVEGIVADYVEANPTMHILYEVTPIFEGDNLLASMVTMKAMSVEDNGKTLNLSTLVRNEQQGVIIDYATGKSKGPEFLGT